ncbi:MAG: molybdopterin cofactor-binding domain-containing protein [Bryobacteraceae bacterium]|nr:molybdopterin cofactor-binding domain-containing protein [Bryobacteraceae bacterium]
MHDELFEQERYELWEPAAYSFAPDRRQFLQSLAAGLLIVAVAPGQRATNTSLEARLHIGEDGRVTILSGKVEEGQGPRAELAAAAAEELGLQVSDIDVVLGDTALVPNDGITAGSRTTPGTVPLVRRAAATARELLRSAGASSYKELAKAPQLVKAYKEGLPEGISVRPAGEWRVLGKPQARPNSRDIVTGAHKFPSDVERPGMLYGAVLRPPTWGATLAALKSPTVAGATVVRDGDFAACFAPTSFAARKGVEALAEGAEWKEKPHPASSENLYDHLRQTAQQDRARPTIRGDVQAALASASKRLKAAYRAAYIQHAPMEPRAAVAEWQDDQLTVWTGTSNPFAVREQLAQAFSIAQSKVRVIVPDFGGGFGGKHTGEAAIEAARLARAAGKPVHLRWTRAEEFTWAYARPAALIEVEGAVDDQRNIAAWDFTNYNSGGSAIETPYRTPNARIRFLPGDSPLRQGSYRALASTANNFAREAFTDELAAAAGMDPLEFRLANLANDRIRAVLVAAAEKFGWKERAKQTRANRGVGLACGTEKNSVVAACVEVEVDPKTGAPRLLEIVEAFECGAILNPAGLRAQVEGCILMGLGAALREELLFAGGRLKNPRFSGYRVPRFRDVPPKMEILLLDQKGAEPAGAGETPIIAVAPAMANAMFQATGKRVRSLPLRLV